MDGAALLREGFALFRSFQRAATAASDKLTRGAVLVSYKARFGEYAEKVDAFLATNPDLSASDSGALRSAVVLARDGENQTAKHPDSYLNRINVYLQNGRANSDPSTKPDPKKLLLLLAAVVVLALVFLRR